jgi:hypothetical protein
VAFLKLKLKVGIRISHKENSGPKTLQRDYIMPTLLMSATYGGPALFMCLYCL